MKYRSSFIDHLLMSLKFAFAKLLMQDVVGHILCFNVFILHIKIGENETKFVLISLRAHKT